MAQRGKSSEFISTGSKLFLDIRPDHYLPSLEGIDWLGRFLWTVDLQPKCYLAD